MGRISDSIWLTFDAAALTERLKVLVGLPLTDIWRPIWQCFEFGEQKPALNKKGDEITRADYSVTLTGDWAVTLGSLVVMGSGDHKSNGKRRFYDRVTPPREPEARDRWKRAKAFFQLIEEAKLIVESILVTPSGLILISLSDGYVIQGMQCNADNSELFDWSDEPNQVFMYVCTDQMSFRQGEDSDSP